MRLLLWLAFALVLLVVVCSASLRLAGSGVGCTPWPTCQTQAAAAANATDDAVPEWQQVLRLTHRISATAAGLVFVFIVSFGFGSWSPSQRVAGVSLLALAVALALVGRVTPSQLPAVVLANLLGGHLLLAALAWLLSPALRPFGRVEPAARWIGWPLCAGVLLLLASGGVVSARGAASACVDGCHLLDPQAWSEAPSAWNLWRGNSAWSLDAVAMARGSLLLHGVLGVLAPVGLALAAWRLRQRAAAAPAVALLTLVVAVALLGLPAVQQALQLPAAVAHSVLAGLTLAGCAALWRAQRR